MITTGMDHAVIAVPDLEAARREFESLGFHVAPKAVHENFGTANHLAVFRDDYLELITVENRSPRDMTSQLALLPSLAKGGGVPMLALATSDPVATHRALLTAGVETADPLFWSRAADTPEGVRTASFTTVFPRSELLPGMLAFVCQHHTPEFVRHAAWLNHPNGALRLVGLDRETTEDLGILAATVRRRFGDAAVIAGAGTVDVRLGRHLLRYRAGADDGYCTVVIAVDSLDRAGSALGSRALPAAAGSWRVELHSTRASLLFVKDGTWP